MSFSLVCRILVKDPCSLAPVLTRTLHLTTFEASPLPSLPLHDIEGDVIRHCAAGRIQDALFLLDGTVKQCIWHSIKLHSCILKACVLSAALVDGKKVHDLIIRSGYDTNVFLQNTLVDMYSKCGSVYDASYIFANMGRHNVFSYTAMISTYVEHGEDEKAVELFQIMLVSNLVPDKVLYTLLMKACGNLASFERANIVHFGFIVSSVEQDLFVDNALIDMYAKCSTMFDAHQVFNTAKVKDVILWTSLITGYAQQGENNLAFHLFDRMKQECVKPNNITCVTILKVCASLVASRYLHQLHTFIIANDMHLDGLMQNALIDMYARCNRIDDAYRIFDNIEDGDVVAWNVMIKGYVQHGHSDHARALFEKMQKRGIKPNQITFMSILKGCTQLSDTELGELVHAQIIESSYDSDIRLRSSLIDMYAERGRIVDARKIFDNMENSDVVTWTSIISYYVKQGNGGQALVLFEQMKRKHIKPDGVAFITALKACSTVGALQHGKKIHYDITRNNVRSDLMLRNTLIDMYAKCGNLENAHEVFYSKGARDVVSWNIIISGYGQQGLGEQAVNIFKQMLDEGEQPNEATFLSVLTACRHSGLLDYGHLYFKLMIEKYDIPPTMEHYACMVDLLCRVGREDEAEAFILRMKVEPDTTVWMSLLGGCRCRSKVDIGERAFQHIKCMNPNSAGAYVLFSNILALAGMWEDAAKVRQEMVLMDTSKEAGCTWIEVGDEIHAFTETDESHPQWEAIRAELKRLSIRLGAEGYKANINTSFHYTGDEDKIDGRLCEHSEKLAVAFGLISSPPETPIHITKNIRLCGDCHAAMKMISKLENRAILGRDPNRFHHFKNGVCSCEDYW